MEINGKNYQLTYGLRPMFIFEEMLDKPFEVKTLMDTYVFCYTCIISNKDNPSLDFNEFINACDENPGIIQEFTQFIESKTQLRKEEDKKKVEKNCQ